MFDKYAFYNKNGNDCRTAFLRIVDHIPVPILFMENDSMCVEDFALVYKDFKNEFLY